MQNLDVLTINLWNILISLCNLLIMFLILKHFLYKPVKKMMDQRKAALQEQYDSAEQAVKEADRNRAAWEEKMQTAETEAGNILKKAAEQADRRGGDIVDEARRKADGIMRDAQTQAALEYKKAQAEIKKEIVDVSAVLTEKLLQREINPEDHRQMIDSVLSEIGEDDDGDR